MRGTDCTVSLYQYLNQYTVPRVFILLTVHSTVPAVLYECIPVQVPTCIQYARAAVQVPKQYSCTVDVRVFARVRVAFVSCSMRVFRLFVLFSSLFTDIVHLLQFCFRDYFSCAVSLPFALAIFCLFVCSIFVTVQVIWSIYAGEHTPVVCGNQCRSF